MAAGLCNTNTYFCISISIEQWLKNPKGAQTQKDMHDTKEKMEGTIVEYIHGMPVIKIFNRTLSAFHQFEENISAYVNIVEHTAYHFASRMGAYYAFRSTTFVSAACRFSYFY